MTHKDCITQRRKFQHLTKEKRAQIEILMEQKIPKKKIAEMVGISRSTLHNELKRGTVDQIDSELRPYRKYCWDAGQRVYEEHRKNSRPALKLVKAIEFVQYAEEQILQNKLSPDAICGLEKIEHKFEHSVCTKTLYNYIDQCLLCVRNIDLLLKVKRKSKTERDRQHKRLYGMSIDERPSVVDDRTEFGHWEIDTVVGCMKSSAVLLTIDERMTRMRHIIKIPSRTADDVAIGIAKLRSIYGSHFSKVFRSVTSDNGSEFAHLSEQIPEADVYYAHPYSAGERGTNEKQNSLVRRFFPKGSSFDSVSDDAISRVELWINSLPRKILNYSSSAAFFQNVLFDIAI